MCAWRARTVFFFAAGDRAGPDVVLAAVRAGVAPGVIAELAEYPSAENGAQPGLRQVDLSFRVPVKMRLHLPLQRFDLGLQGGQDRRLGAHAARVGAAEHRRLAQPRAANAAWITLAFSATWRRDEPGSAWR